MWSHAYKAKTDPQRCPRLPAGQGSGVPCHKHGLRQRGDYRAGHSQRARPGPPACPGGLTRRSLPRHPRGRAGQPLNAASPGTCLPFPQEALCLRGPRGLVLLELLLDVAVAQFPQGRRQRPVQQQDPPVEAPCAARPRPNCARHGGGAEAVRRIPRAALRPRRKGPGTGRPRKAPGVASAGGGECNRSLQPPG